jgi:intracellular multiplication protein IcmP
MSEPLQASQGTDLPGFVVALIAVVALAVIAWLLGHSLLIDLWIWAKSLEISAIQVIFPHRFVHLARALATVRAEHLQAKVHFATVSTVNQRIGRYIGPVCALPILFFALITFRARQKRLKHYTTEEVVEAMAERYPWGRYWNLNIHTQNPHQGPFALAKRPWDLARELGAAYWESVQSDQLIFHAEPFASYFTDQLGSDELAHLHPAVTALVYAILPQAATGDGKTTYDRLAELTRWATDDRKDLLRKVREIQPHKLRWSPSSEEWALWQGLSSQHYFARTQFLALVAKARSTGLLPPVWLLWLKGIDRHLYYAVQSLGNGGGMAFVEGAGILAHYRAERAEGRALVHPRIEEAVTGIEAALRQVRE